MLILFFSILQYVSLSLVNFDAVHFFQNKLYPLQICFTF
ncbi:hypothetical protein RUMGNA_01149 [Mediterraneibacter gnavus ATCC 29149]|uniref:Uncharacterized protein n=1 Tax=Mediterraneibacter gnavus (strain ATCC 29149 / DSM 114966 / JCM 6515 / VPI C7-9) TaxID=411470 RepID=A7B0S4_MEDG7|nr:hypothetical protein RUMGNA_01149 [Mediterraneibacter gnavus ATCC 29149]